MRRERKVVFCRSVLISVLIAYCGVKVPKNFRIDKITPFSPIIEIFPHKSLPIFYNAPRNFATINRKNPHIIRIIRTFALKW